MSGFVLITRHPSDCARLQELLTPCGLTLRPYPVLRLDDVTDENGWRTVCAANPGDGDGNGWLILASPRAPERFVRACRAHAMEDLLALPAAAVGSATAEAGEAAGLRVELVGPGNGIGLARLFNSTVDRAATVVFACGRERRRELPQRLTEAGHTVLPVEVYRMTPTPPRELPPLGPSLAAVVLTSPRAASLYLDGVGGIALPCPHWALGRTTRQAASNLGIECRIPAEATMQSLAEELCKI